MQYLDEYEPLGKCYVLGSLEYNVRGRIESLYYEVIYDGKRRNVSAFDAVDAYGFLTQEVYSGPSSRKETRYGLNRDNRFGDNLLADAVRFVPDHISWLKILLERCAVFDLDQEEAHKIVLQDFDYMTELVDMTEFYRALGYDTLQEVRSTIK